MYSIVLVDDHVMLRNALATIINRLDNFMVLFEADNGRHFISQIAFNIVPDIVLLDITMPEMDGYATAAWIKKHHPKIKVMALSMMDNETSIIRMISNGAKGFMVKNAKTEELVYALNEIMKKGFYFNDYVNSKIAKAIQTPDGGSAEDIPSEPIQLTPKEIEFLIQICTEKSHKEIAEHMQVSHRTVDYYRDTLFHKLGLKTRIGLVIHAFKTGIVKF